MLGIVIMGTETTEPQGKSRQDQILLLAAEGMTDKEIAARLSLSPETVGTYWRRILSKYSAASRTEVVAKVVRLQAEESINQIAELNDCLQAVTDHLLLELSGRQVESPSGDSKYAVAAAEKLQSYFTVVDEEGFVLFVNRHIPGITLIGTDPLEWAVVPEDRDKLRDALSQILNRESQEKKVSLGFSGEDGAAIAAKLRLVPLDVDDEACALIEISL